MLVLRNFSLEDYEDLSDNKKVSKLTYNQKKMLLEDERAKARRNTEAIVDEARREGGNRGKKKGGKIGTAIGGAAGLGGTAALYLNKELKKGHKIAGGIAAPIAGAGVGYLLGRGIGKLHGSSKGARKGRQAAKEGGHDEVDVMLRQARKLDDYERRGNRRGKDNWEIGVREQLKAEKREAEERAARERAEELEERRVRADERRAGADMVSAAAKVKEADARYMDSATNRYRYMDESGRTKW